MGNDTDTLEFGILEEVPEFIGGNAAMARFIRDNVRFPDDLVYGERVYVGFVVDADGSVVTVKSRKGTDKQLVREAERVVRSMPKWRPGKLNGRAVPCRMVLPISFETK
jgi:protein TonB